MVETLIISVIVLTITVLFLVGYFFYYSKKTKPVDLDNPEFLKLQNNKKN